MLGFHLVFRATGGQKPFLGRENAAFFLRELQRRLSPCLAYVLMPNHGHILVRPGELKQATKAIRLALIQFKKKVPSHWEPIPEPASIPDLKHLRRQVRYVHLNPCRSNLTSDPLAWEFSSHREVLGYSPNPISKLSVQDLSFQSPAEFHRYVSSDSTTTVSGSSLPRAIVKNKPGFPMVSLDRVAVLSVELTHQPAEAIRKRGHARGLFIILAEAAGYDNYSLIARYLGVSKQSISSLRLRGNLPVYSKDLATALLTDHRLGGSSVKF